jgi:hypothetical protein
VIYVEWRGGPEVIYPSCLTKAAFWKFNISPYLCIQITRELTVWLNDVEIYTEAVNDGLRVSDIHIQKINADMISGGERLPEPYMLNPYFWAMRGIEFVAGNFNTITSRFGSNLGIMETLADQSQLPYEQSNLHNSSAEQKQREDGQATSVRTQGMGLISEPLRFISQFFVNPGFFGPFLLLLLGLLFGAFGGENFYRERYFVGSALIGCGWLCGVGAWVLYLLLGTEVMP